MGVSLSNSTYERPGSCCWLRLLGEPAVLNGDYHSAKEGGYATMDDGPSSSVRGNPSRFRLPGLAGNETFIVLNNISCFNPRKFGL
jgi:hypothetical protein